VDQGKRETTIVKLGAMNYWTSSLLPENGNRKRTIDLGRIAMDD